MKQKLMTIALSIATTLLTLTGVLWGLVTHAIPLPNTADKDGVVVRSHLWLEQGVIYSEIYAKNGALLRTRSYYLFDPERTMIWNDLHHKIMVQKIPSPDSRITQIFKEGQPAPICSNTLSNIFLPNQRRAFFDGTGATITEDQYKEILASK